MANCDGSEIFRTIWCSMLVAALVELSGILGRPTDHHTWSKSILLDHPYTHNRSLCRESRFPKVVDSFRHIFLYKHEMEVNH